MKLIYVAGRFSGMDRACVERNIEAATQVGLQVAAAGAMPVIPHANTQHPEFETLQPYEFWIAGTMALLERCDALITVPGWEASKGACGEVKRATELGMPRFGSVEELKQWLEGDHV